MDDDLDLTRQFEAHRPHLRAVAYRVLGSAGDAEDAVQEAWLRLHRTDTAEVDNLGGWLTTVVARIALNTLRSRSTRREESLEERVERLPEPMLTPDDARQPQQPEHQALLADSVGLALLVVLDQLSPAERIAFVLHDLFAVPFDDIAPVLERSPAATRQLASRARRRVSGSASPAQHDQVQHDPAQHDPVRRREVVDAFFAAARDGDLPRLLGVLAPDVVVHADHGALRGVVTYRGAESVAGNALRYAHPERVVHPVRVDDLTGVLVTLHGEPFSIMAFTVAQGRVVEIHTWTDSAQVARVSASLGDYGSVLGSDVQERRRLVQQDDGGSTA
ncbi:sigma-70 family RNA polymerase sigma factor [Nocardioides sp. W7]|uniref:sigma-70 family RNA polymerase sigma factor n=1 Tax=Nocardioides sp. W7 TaxID=2931390 RepID=UPI001FD1AD76|nr:sigma-70 family RNA polymerase sigma factor [Nocardioides sp. W7]